MALYNSYPLSIIGHIANLPLTNSSHYSRRFEPSILRGVAIYDFSSIQA